MRDVSDIRKDFLILNQKIHGRNLVYLDNAATTQIPEQVINAMTEHLHCFHGNTHGGNHFLSEMSQACVKNVREKTGRFIEAAEPAEIVFTSGTTDSINIVARALGEAGIKPGSHIITTQMEHHSNLFPWQQLCKRMGAVLHVVGVLEDGTLDMEEYERLLELKPVAAAFTSVSNVLGSVNPIEKMVSLAKEAGAITVVDGAQAMRHIKFDVKSLGCDFFCFSAHKMMGPTGVGILYGRRERLEALIPVRFGGGMVSKADLKDPEWEQLPYGWEAGTPNITGLTGFGAALDYLEKEGIAEISAYEGKLLAYTEEILRNIEGIHIPGDGLKFRAGAISFFADAAFGYDIARLLDQQGVAVRSGHHCAQPLVRRFGVDNLVRVSPAFYNTKDEIDLFAEALERTVSMLR